MHFSIPETKEIKHGFKTFITYLIYINGSFHCSLRYRQLYHFHIQLKKAFGANFLPDFPPKKFLSLNSAQIEERRLQLEKYIQIVSQDSQIINSEIFNGFLLAAQQESHNDFLQLNTNNNNDNQNTIDIYQLDWQQIRLITNGNENSENLLKKICQTVQLDESFVPYFALYLIERYNNNNNLSDNNNYSDYRIIRRLQNFESPLLTLRTIIKRSTAANNDNNANNFAIIIRKSYFDNQFDKDLFNNDVALNFIYLQTVNDIENGHIICSDNETKKCLNQFKRNNNKLEYIKLSSLQKFYGYIHFEPCFCDLPLPSSQLSSSSSSSSLSTSNMNVKLFAGNQELIIQANDTDEYIFRIIRIKCWRLTTSNNNNNNRNDESKSLKDEKRRFELSFEYLINKGCLQWITIYSSQAVLISYCLQSMVEEMLLKREGKKFRSEGLTIRYNTSPNSKFLNNNNNNQMSNVINNNTNDNNITNNNNSNDNNTNNIEWNYYKQDGTQFPLSTSSSTTTLTSEKSQNSEKSNQLDHNTIIDIKINNEIIDPLSVQQRFQEISLVENDVFNEIGDDDL